MSEDSNVMEGFALEPEVSFEETNQEPETTTAIVKAEPRYADMDDATLMALFTESGALTDSAKLGDGFHKIDKELNEAVKRALVGVPLIVIDWKKLLDEESQRFYASIRVRIIGALSPKLMQLTQGNANIRISDGSTGIFPQLQEAQERGMGAIACKHGLRASDYVKDIPGKGKQESTTFYLDTSA